MASFSRTASDCKKTVLVLLHCPAKLNNRTIGELESTRSNPFLDEIQEQLQQPPGLQAKTVFQSLQRQPPSQFQDGRLRTLQRRIKQWRATDGPAKEIYFVQVHHPGDLCASDYTRGNQSAGKMTMQFS